jgi:hypothetical protein
VKAVALWIAAISVVACNRAQPAPVESTPPDDSDPLRGRDNSPGIIAEGLSPPAGLDVEALERVPGISGVALRQCAALPDGFTGCAFTADNGLETRVVFRAFDSNASTQFECESRAGAAADTLTLGAGYSRWDTGQSVLTATDSLCFSTQVFQNGALDRDESLRVGTELAENAASAARDESL